MGWSDTVYVEKLTEFSALLRQEGLTVGPQETADACAVLEVLDLTDRSTVRDALRAVYAKSRQEQAAFDSAFDGFFVSQERKEAIFARRQAEAEELARRRAEAEQELQVGGKPMDLREDLQEVYATMPEEKREYLRQLLEKSKGNLERSPQLYSNFIRSVFMRFLLEQQMMMEDAAVGSEALDPDLALLYRDISQFKDADIPRATALIARVAQQLSAELSKRRRRGGHSGQLDFKKTIRRGLETGGSFYRLSFRRKRHRRRRLVVLCDVSGSMLQFTEFTLRFLKSMAEVSDASRTFLFSEELREVDPFALQEMDAFRAYVRSSGLYGRGTDLGSALEALRQMKPSALAGDHPPHPLRHQDHRPAPGGPGAAGGEAAGGEGAVAQPHPGAEVALCPQHRDHVRPVPDGALQHPGGAGPGLPAPAGTLTAPGRRPGPRQLF